MSQTIRDYLENISKEYASGRAREHSYRPALKTLLENLKDTIHAVNEPSRERAGAPDFIIMDSKNIPRGYIEAKDIIPNILDDSKNKAQIAKYFDGELGYNFIHTDNIEFRFYRNAELVESVQIAELVKEEIQAKPENFEKFEMLLLNFLSYQTQTIRSSKKLSEIMAGKARMIREVVSNVLKNNIETLTEIHNQYKIFKDLLVHDLDETSFADIYAQTIVYGLFTARLHDPTLPTFDRDEAARLLPKSNPFLKKFFQSLRDDLDPRIEWIVDDLVEVFLASDVKTLLEGYGSSTARNDPIIHFYEDFLANYDKKLRKAKGVYYTPEPVVNFMVRSMDEILKTYFEIPEGIADTSKIEIVREEPGKKGKLVKVKKQVHKVQILDPATGTGTFLDAIVKYIHKTKFSAMQGVWANYVEKDLIPRLHGFEYMMASYAMAHLKLDLTLKETGYDRDINTAERFGIYLTNSLEEQHEDTGSLFANYLASESKEANMIKRDTPVMCVIGNPPYKAESSNQGNWILKILEDYKKEPGGKTKLQERNPKWINDDYVKFIRLAQYFIEKNNEGVLAYICPHGFLDNPTFRGMRWNLLKNFDEIYTIDLHGNAKKKEVSPDGSPDQNIFDIQQGVAVTFFIKTGKKPKNQLGDIYHYDIFGKREKKYDWLNKNTFSNIDFQKLQTQQPNYFFVPKEFKLLEKYSGFISIKDLFPINGVGLTTAHDEFVIKEDKDELLKNYQDFQSSERDEDILHNKFSVKKKKGWNILNGYDNIKHEKNLEKYIQPISYRPFDEKYIFYEDKLVWRTVRKVMQHFIEGENIGLTTARSNKSPDISHFFISKNITETKFSERSTQSAIFPLYLYTSTNQKSLGDKEIVTKTPNLDMEIVGQIEKKLGLKFEFREDDDYSDVKGDFFTPENLLDYIYAVLHSRSYRETYKEFLKIDFPRVPFNTDTKTFFKLAKLGKKLREYHLMTHKDIKPGNFITSYDIPGDNIVEKISYKDEKVFINTEQYFDGVPQEVYEFYIGGYQPAQKWLKDRRGRELSHEDILHYSKIVLVLSKTIEIMDEIEKIFAV